MRALIAILLLAAPAAATAQPAPAQTCSVRIVGMDFGTYSALTASPDISLGRIELTCFPPVATASARVTLSTGSSGHFLDRTMTRGPYTLRYNLYADTARRRVLGDGTGGTVLPEQLTRSLGRAAFRVYGVITPRQAVPAGEYSDTIRVDVEF